MAGRAPATAPAVAAAPSCVAGRGRRAAAVLVAPAAARGAASQLRSARGARGGQPPRLAFAAPVCAAAGDAAGAGGSGWVQQQQDAAQGSSKARPLAPRSLNQADKESYMSFEDEMHVFGYEPREGEQVYGPPVLLLAGLRAEEVPKVRQLLDELGGQSVKVLPASREMLTVRLRDALRAPEPDWRLARPVDAAYGGGFGAARVVLFSGLDTGEKGAVVSAMEARGLPRLCVTSAAPHNVDTRLGEVLAQAVAEDRKYAARIAAMKRGEAPAAADAVEEDAEEEAAALADLGRADAAVAAAAAAAKAAAAQPHAAFVDEEDDADADEEDDGDAETHREAMQAAEALRFSQRANNARAASPARASPQAEASQPPAWQTELDAFQAEVSRRGEAGEDLSFLSDPNAKEPPWVTELLASRALENFFSAEALADLERQRDDAEAAEEARYGGGAPCDEDDAEEGAQHEHDLGSMEEGYASMEELLAALTAERGPAAAARAQVFGPDPPPPPPPSSSASAR